MFTPSTPLEQFVSMSADTALNPHRQLRRYLSAQMRVEQRTAMLIEAYTPNRPAKISRGPCNLNPAVKLLVRRADGYCRYCIDGEAETVDHILPWSRGGANCPSNLVGCCRDCNAAKGDLTPVEAGMVMDVPDRLAGRLKGLLV